MARNRKKTKTVDSADVTETRRTEPSQLPLPTGSRLMEAIAQVKGYNEKIDHLTGKRRQYLKTLKAEGIDIKVVTDLIKLEKADPLTARSYYEQLGVGLKEIATPFQLSVFDVAFGSPIEQAKAEARAQAKAGRAMEPGKWAEGSSEYQAYCEEYSRIQASMVPGAENLSEAELNEAIADGMAAAK